MTANTIVVIALIVVGGALVAAPLVAEYQLMSNHQANVVRLLEKPETSRVNLYREELRADLKYGCWLIGTVMAVAGIYLAVRHARTAPASSGQSG